MKAAMVFLVLSLRAMVAIAVVTRYESNVAVSSSGSKHVEPAQAPMPAPPSKEAFHINFEIANLNYFDLTKEACPHKPHMVNGKELHDHDDHPHESEDVVDEVVSHIDGFSDQLKSIANGVIPAAKEVAKDVEDAAKDAEHTVEDGVSTLQLAEGTQRCETVMELMRESIEKAIRDVVISSPPAVAAILGGGPAPASIDEGKAYDFAVPPGLAPAPAPSFLQKHNSSEQKQEPVMMVSGPAPPIHTLTADTAPKVAQDINIFVTFATGKAHGAGKATKVDIAFTDTPGNNVQGLLAALPALKLAIKSGMLREKVAKFISAAVGIEPKILAIDSGMKETKQYPVAKCEKHLKELVGHFSVHYTREQVPRALYNECTNFMTKISFSNDYVLDPLDTERCEKATAKFTQKWKYGKQVAPDDFQSMCLEACKAKFGRRALQCDIDDQGSSLVFSVPAPSAKPAP